MRKPGPYSPPLKRLTPKSIQIKFTYHHGLYGITTAYTKPRKNLCEDPHGPSNRTVHSAQPSPMRSPSFAKIEVEWTSIYVYVSVRSWSKPPPSGGYPQNKLIWSPAFGETRNWEQSRARAAGLPWVRPRRRQATAKRCASSLEYSPVPCIRVPQSET